jgi:O-antigen ligase
MPAREDGRMLGPFGEANLFAAFLALFIPGIVALALTETGWRKWGAWVGVCCSAIALLLTGSRGGVVSLVGGALFAATMLRRYIGLRTLLLTTAIGLTLVLGAVGVAVLTGQDWLLFERFIWLSGEGTVDALSSGRLGIWQEPLLRLLQNPLTLITGYGWDTYAQAPYFRFAPHNSYLKILYELGFLGLGFLVAALVAIVARANAAIGTPDKQTLYHVAAFLCGFPAFLLAIFFVDFVAPLFAWAYAGVVLRMAMEAEGVARERVHGIAVKTAENRI